MANQIADESGKLTIYGAHLIDTIRVGYQATAERRPRVPRLTAMQEKAAIAAVLAAGELVAALYEGKQDETLD